MSTLSVNKKEKLWVEKYRPKTIEECVLPTHIKTTFTDIFKSGEMPNMILAGSAGTGKTTVAKALCEMMGMDWLIINASDENGIDVVRTKIRNFASTVSLGDAGHKVVILDEADYLNPNSTQPALRNFIEEFSSNCSFILTCNFPNRIIDPLHSRCMVVEFSIPKDEKKRMAAELFKRLCSILDIETYKTFDEEGNEIQAPITYDKKVIAELVMKFFPDNRRVIGELQKYARSGVIDEGILSSIKDADFDALIRSLKEKNFKNVRQWVADNSDVDTSLIYRKVYDNIQPHLQPNSVPEVILILAEYQKWNSSVADAELHLTAMFVEILSSAQFK